MSINRYQSDILKLSAEGKTTREIVDWLETKGFHTSHMTVGRFLRRKREERAHITQQALREELPKQVTKDLEVLNAIIDDAAEKADLVEASWILATQQKTPPDHLAGRISDWIKLKDLQLRTIALKLTHSGALNPRENAPGQNAPIVVIPRPVSFEEWEKLWKAAKK